MNTYIEDDIDGIINKFRSRSANRTLEKKQAGGRAIRSLRWSPIDPIWVDAMVSRQLKINELRLQDDIRAGYLNTLIAAAEKGSVERLSTILEFNAATISLVKEPVGVGCEIKDSELAFDYAMKILER